ncbi:Uncharacterised protein [Burkholderia pseudomallei]|nr:Uncharacterised protein [Burkholderia pseudomallei]
MNDKQNTAPNWLQEGDLLYRLTADTHRQSHDEIYVTLAEGSRDMRARAARAAELREILNRITLNQAVDAWPDTVTRIRRLVADNMFAISFQTMQQYRSALLNAIDTATPTFIIRTATTREQRAAIEFALGACAGHPAGELHVAALESLLDANDELWADAALTAAACDVLAERQRQVDQEGCTHELDDEYTESELAQAAACYVQSSANCDRSHIDTRWPWPTDWWKPTTPRRNLVKAGALILAEIERLDRDLGGESNHNNLDGGSL